MSNIEIFNLNKNNPILSVALPIYDMPLASKFSIYGLIKQKCDFSWEIICLQEEYNYFHIENYFDQLEKAGCCKVTIVKYKDKVTVGEKLNLAINLSSGKVFCYQGADDKPHKLKLKKNKEAIIDNNKLFYAERKGLFFNLHNNITILFDRNSKKNYNPGLNQAYDLNRLKQNLHLFPKFKRMKKNMDGTLYRILNIKDFETEVEINDRLYRDGFYSDGLNKISVTRKNYYDNIKQPFIPTSINLDPKFINFLLFY